MKLKAVLLLLVGLIANSSAQSASCQYVETFYGYTCRLTMNNPLGAEFDEIPGEHLEGFSNEDVAMVYSWDGSTTNVPEAICRQFSNADQLDLSFFGITSIGERSFSGCENLTFLRLWFNQIAEIPLGTFANNNVLRYLDLDGNNITTLPENVFSNLNQLNMLEIRNNPFESIPAGAFNGLENLETLFMSNVRITEINPAWFASTPNLLILYLYFNQISSFNAESFTNLENLIVLDIAINPLTQPIPGNTFASLTNLLALYMDSLRLTEVNPQWLNGLNNLIVLTLYSNQLTSIEENTFESLSNLIILDLDSNRGITDLPNGAFNGLTSLQALYLSQLSLRFLRNDWFSQTPNLYYLMLNFNQIEDLPSEVFINLNDLTYLGLWANDIKTIRRDQFGNLNNLWLLDLDENTINAIEQQMIDDAPNLTIFYFWNNVCASGSFFDFNTNRVQHLVRLNRCFRNFMFIVETVTEGDNIYRFYPFPEPGVFFRVDAYQEVHISLNPVNFEATPRIEIRIGINRNTRSQIIFNGDETVVDISTPDILNEMGWSGFRVSFSNWVVLVFREGDQFPFMGANMRQFYPISHYGIRTPGLLSPWMIQPLDADGNI